MSLRCRVVGWCLVVEGARNFPYPSLAVIELSRELRCDRDAASAAADLVQKGVSGWRQPVAGAWAARSGETRREFPALQAGDEEFPERSDDSRHVQLQALRALHDATAGLQHVALKAAEVAAAAGRRFVFDPQHRRQVEGQQRQSQQGFVGVEVVV